jgi:hypothetical protein
MSGEKADSPLLRRRLARGQRGGGRNPKSEGRRKPKIRNPKRPIRRGIARVTRQPGPARRHLPAGSFRHGQPRVVRWGETGGRAPPGEAVRARNSSAMRRISWARLASYQLAVTDGFRFPRFSASRQPGWGAKFIAAADRTGCSRLRVGLCTDSPRRAHLPTSRPRPERIAACRSHSRRPRVGR